jgi:uncharacterized protein
MKQKLLALLALLCIIGYVHGACQSCIMFPVPFAAGQGQHSRAHAPAAMFSSRSSSGSPFMPLGILLAKQVITTVIQQKMATPLAAEEKESHADADADAVEPMSALMVGAIGFYKGWISPLLPPACRFVPTCSQYGVQAIQDFGPGKGSILIAWRLLRCSPIGGKGYDPPKWPPVSYTYSSY